LRAKQEHFPKKNKRSSFHVKISRYSLEIPGIEEIVNQRR